MAGKYRKIALDFRCGLEGATRRARGLRLQRSRGWVLERQSLTVCGLRPDDRRGHVSTFEVDSSVTGWSWRCPMSVRIGEQCPARIGLLAIECRGPLQNPNCTTTWAIAHYWGKNYLWGSPTAYPSYVKAPCSGIEHC